MAASTPSRYWRTAQEILWGSTRFFDIYPEHKKLEIGWTWYTPAAWGKHYNLEAKLLMLTYGFETLHLQRVALKTRTSNIHSRRAIEQLGAAQEGILRKDRIGHDGHTRDTVLYSILDAEWPDLKLRLQQRLAAV